MPIKGGRCVIYDTIPLFANYDLIFSYNILFPEAQVYQMLCSVNLLLGNP